MRYDNVVDLLLMVDAFGSILGDPNYDPWCDFNSDGSIDVVDLLGLVYNFGRSFTSPQLRSQSIQQSVMRAAVASDGAAVPKDMNVYDALEFAGLLDVYLDYLAEHPEAAGTK